MSMLPPTTNRQQERSGSEQHRWERYKRRLYLAIGIVAFLVVFANFVNTTLSILLLLFLSVLIAVGLCGVRDWLVGHTSIHENLALLLVVLAVLALLVGTILLIGTRISDQFSALREALPAAQRRLEAELSQYDWGRQLVEELPPVSQIDERMIGGDNAFSRITGVFSSTLSFISSAIVTTFIALYLAIEPGTYVNNFLQLVPRTKRARIRQTLTEIYDTLKKWLLTRFLSMLLIGVLTGLGLTLLKVPLALSLAVIAGIGALIPTFGPILAAIPALLVALLQGPGQAAEVLALYLAVQAVDNYLVTPWLQKSMLYLPPAYIVAAQLLFGVIAGSFGLILAAPLAAALVVLVRNLYVEDVIGETKTSGE